MLGGVLDVHFAMGISDVLGLVSNQETSKPKPWFAKTKPNHVHGFELVLVLV
jgi:hypothetical protein